MKHVSGIGLARWPDIPPHGGVAQGFLLIPVSGADDAEGRVREQVGEEKSEDTHEVRHPRET